MLRVTTSRAPLDAALANLNLWRLFLIAGPDDSDAEAVFDECGRMEVRPWMEVIYVEDPAAVLTPQERSAWLDGGTLKYCLIDRGTRAVLGKGDVVRLLHKGKPHSMYIREAMAGIGAAGGGQP